MQPAEPRGGFGREKAVGAGRLDDEQAERAEVRAGVHLFEGVAAGIVGLPVETPVDLPERRPRKIPRLDVDDLAPGLIEMTSFFNARILLHVGDVRAGAQNKAQIPVVIAAAHETGAGQKRRHGVVEDDDALFLPHAARRQRAEEPLPDEPAQRLPRLDLLAEVQDPPVLGGQHFRRVRKTKTDAVAFVPYLLEVTGERVVELAGGHLLFQAGHGESFSVLDDRSLVA